MSGASNNPSNADDRLTGLEESAAFAERKVEQLAEQVLILDRKITEFTRKLAAMETRLARLEEVRSASPAQRLNALPGPLQDDSGPADHP